MRAILVSSDLMVVSHVQGAAARAGVTVEAASNLKMADGFLHGADADLVIVDLGSPTGDLETQVAALKLQSTSPPTVVAFGPHVHADRLAAARDAGCDIVMSRGQFFAQIDSLLAGGSC